LRSPVIDGEAAQSRDEPVKNGIKAARKRRELGMFEQARNRREYQVKL